MTGNPQTVKILIWWVEGGIFAGLLPCLPAFNLTLQKMFGTAQPAFFLQTSEVNFDKSRVVLRRGLRKISIMVSVRLLNPPESYMPGKSPTAEV